MNRTAPAPRCKVGQRAIIIAGLNSGLIVVIRSAYRPGEKVDGLIWLEDDESAPSWVIESLGSNFVGRRQTDKVVVPAGKASRILDSWLVPLPDDAPPARARRKQKVAS